MKVVLTRKEMLLVNYSG